MRLIPLVLLSLLCQQLGASVAGLMFGTTGPAGMVALRLAFSALVLLALTRPRMRTLAGLSRRGWAAVVLLGLTMAGMNLLIYAAFDRIPQGVAVTFEVLGPLALSVLANRRWLSVVWAALAFAGIALLGRDGFSAGMDGAGLDPLGVAFALAAAACWAGFILANRHAGTHLPGVQGLALAMVVGSAVAVPVGAAAAGPVLLEPWVLAVGLGVALLSSSIPYGIEMQVLRTMPTGLFSLITCLSPVVAALTAWAVRGQRLAVLDLVGMGLVVLACAAAVWAAERAAQPSRRTPRTS